MRELFWRSAAPPPELLAEAFAELQQQLKAVKTEFFTWRGEVTDTREVTDNHARLSAIDKVLSMADAYTRPVEPSRKPDGPQTVTIEIGKDGVHRIIVGAVSNGAAQRAELPEREVPQNVIEHSNGTLDVNESGSPMLPPASTDFTPSGLEPEEQVEHIRVTRNTPRDNIRRLFKDDEPTV